MRKVIDLGLTKCNHVLMLNRVMCNIAEYVQRVRTNLSTRYPHGETDLLELPDLPTHFLPSTHTPTGTNSLAPRSSRPSPHAPGDMAQARLTGLSNISVIRVRAACVRGDVLQRNS